MATMDATTSIPASTSNPHGPHDPGETHGLALAPETANGSPSGPFTVESLSPHRMVAVDENDELLDRVGSRRPTTARTRNSRACVRSSWGLVRSVLRRPRAALGGTRSPAAFLSFLVILSSWWRLHRSFRGFAERAQSSRLPVVYLGWLPVLSRILVASITVRRLVFAPGVVRVAIDPSTCTCFP